MCVTFILQFWDTPRSFWSVDYLDLSLGCKSLKFSPSACPCSAVSLCLIRKMRLVAIDRFIVFQKSQNAYILKKHIYKCA